MYLGDWTGGLPTSRQCCKCDSWCSFCIFKNDVPQTGQSIIRLKLLWVRGKMGSWKHASHTRCDCKAKNGYCDDDMIGSSINSSTGNRIRCKLHLSQIICPQRLLCYKLKRIQSIPRFLLPAVMSSK